MKYQEAKAECSNKIGMRLPYWREGAYLNAAGCMVHPEVPVENRGPSYFVSYPVNDAELDEPQWCLVDINGRAVVWTWLQQAKKEGLY